MPIGARRDASENASTYESTPGGGRAALGGIESLRAPSPRQNEKRLKAQLAELTAERDDYRDTVDALLGDCDRYLKRIKELEGRFPPEARDHILAALGVGRQSAQYKRVKGILDEMLS
jgi:hypothetical protein